MKILVFFSLLITSNLIWGHAGEDHSKDGKKVEILSPDDKLKKKYLKINEQYLKVVRPIFKRSCFDCHGNTTKYPWYYKVPGVKKLIDHDVEESKKHIDFSQDFPFISHGTPLKDLDAIGKSVREGSMPPFRYRVMHRDSRLTENEVKQVEQWIEKSKEILK